MAVASPACDSIRDVSCPVSFCLVACGGGGADQLDLMVSEVGWWHQGTELHEFNDPFQASFSTHYLLFEDFFFLHLVMEENML